MTPDQFLQIADPLPESTLLVSGDGIILIGNRATKQRLGISVDSLMGRNLADVVVDPSDEVTRYLKLCCRSRSMVLGAMTLRGPQETQIACRLEGALIQPKVDEAAAVVMLRLKRKESATEQFVTLNRRIEELAREVQRRKRAEDDARRQEAALRVTLFSIGDGVISTDTAGRIVMMNPVAEELTGWTLQEAAGCDLEAVFQTLHEDTAADAEARIPPKQIQAKRPNHVILIAKHGEQRPIDKSVAPIRDSEGDVIGSVLVFRDITETLQADFELRETRQRFQTVFNQQFQMLAILAADGTVLDSNETSFRVTGVQQEQVLGQLVWNTPWWDKLPAMREKWKSHVSEAVAGGVPVTDEMEYMLSDGTIRHATVIVTGLQNESGDITNILLEGHDDTERKRNETILRAQKKVFEILVNGDPLPDVLDALCEVIEGDSTEHITATVLLLDDDGQHLRSVAGRRAPPAYSEAVDGLKIGPDVGSCGRAAFLGEQVVVSDIASDPLWAEFRDLALGHGLRACWSTPIFSSQGKVLGTFAVYYPTPRQPSNDEVQLVEILTRTAGIAIERRRGEEAVQFQARLLDTVGQAAIVTKPDGEIIYWNRYAETLYGWSTDEALGRSAHELQVVPHDRTHGGEIMECLRAGQNWSGEFEVQRRDGTPFHAFVTNTPLLDEEREVKAIIGISVDVTDRIQLEKSLRFLADASAVLAGLVDYENTLSKVASLAVPHFADWCAVDITESDGTLRRLAVAHVDEAKVRLAQQLDERYPPKSDVEFGAYHVLRTGRAEMMEELPDSVLVDGAVDEAHLRILRQLGLKSYICVPLQTRETTLGVITFVTAESARCYTAADLAFAEELARRSAIAIENAQLYQELRDADRRKDEFLATLAHELRNPLAPIRNGLEVLRLSDEESNDAKEVRLMMERQLNQMVRLVDDLLDVSRITRNKLELRKQTVELATVVQSAVETSRPLIEQAGHTFSLTLPTTPVYLSADDTRLAQVFSNLVNNSAKYTPSGGQISLVAEVFEDDVTVTIRDNGMGIPPESLKGIFEVFSQVDRNMGMAQGGLGIGLTLVRRLVEMHGGSVEARSDGPGRGSEFMVRLPVIDDHADLIPSAPAEHDKDSNLMRRVLVVDDIHDSAISLSMMLTRMGHETCTAHDGLAAVEAASEFRPDLILLDIGLPKMNGYDACRRIREQSWSDKMVIVALTGWGQKEDRRRSAEAGFDHHLVKPVELAALHDLLAGPVTQPPPAASESQAPAASLKVLVVDDMRDATFMLKTLLEKAGHDVCTASNGPTAIELAHEHQPDAVMLDINMPGMSGIEVARQLRQHPALKDIVLIAMTGSGEEADRQRTTDAGFDHHLIKPADIRIITEVLATVKSKPR